MSAKPLLARVDDWPAFLGETLSADELEPIRAGERTGRPLGTASFLKQLERKLGRSLARQKPGAKPKASGDDGE